MNSQTLTDTEDSVSVRKHSALIQVSGNTMTLTQQKIFISLLFFARDQLKKDKQGRMLEYSVAYSDLKKMSGVSSPNNNELHKNLEGLMDIRVKPNFLGKDKKNTWSAFNLLAGAENVNGYLVFSLPHQINKTLVQPNIYASLKMSIVRSFSDRHSLALYELAYDYKKFGTPSIPISDLKELFGVNNSKSYVSFKDFNRYVLKKAVSEINKKSDITITPFYEKNGRSVVSIRFAVESPFDLKKDSNTAALPENAIDPEIAEIIESLSSGKGAGYYNKIMNSFLSGDISTISTIEMEKKKIHNKAISDRLFTIMGTKIGYKYDGENRTMTAKNWDRNGGSFSINGFDCETDGAVSLNLKESQIIKLSERI